MTSEFTIAVHALVYLNHRKEIITSDELAKNVCTNPARVRKVMSRLKKAGLVGTKEGLDGGYYMEREPSSLNLRQIAGTLEVTLVKASWKSGNKEMDCLVSSGMADVMDGIYAELNCLCQKHLESVTIEDLDRKIFGKKQVLEHS